MNKNGGPIKRQVSGTITRITVVAEGIKRFALHLEKEFAYIPGQYIMLAFVGEPANKRAFSIVSVSKNTLVLYIKQEGKFTERLFSSKLGQKMLISGPYGRFTIPKKETQLVLIAGGIGVTPLYNILKHTRPSSYKKSVFLFYSGKSENQMALLPEIKRLKGKHIFTRFFFTKKGPNERITIKKIKTTVKQFKESLFYLCGPIAMMEDIKSQLIHVHIKEDKIMQEQFN